MLVLTRRSGESLIIGGNIRVHVLRTTGSRVRIGIEAPDDVRIVREKASGSGEIEIDASAFSRFPMASDPRFPVASEMINRRIVEARSAAGK